MPRVLPLAAAGAGVALVPSSLVHMRRAGVVYRPLAEAGPPVELGVVWREAERSRPAAAFVNHVCAAFPAARR